MGEIKRLGLIAGKGKLPILAAKAAKEKGIEIVAIALTDSIGEELIPFSEKVFIFSVGQAGKIINTLKQEQVRYVIILGKVDKGVIFNKFCLDWRALRSIRRVVSRNDESLFLVIKEELGKDGLQLLNQTLFLEDYLIKKGVLTKRQPTNNEWRDIEFGYRLAKEIGRLDIGQTVVVKDRAVLAVEAMEGTDEAIRRGCHLGNGNTVVVKVSRPQQDFLLDVPTVGSGTIETMKAGKATVLALEAEKTLVIDLKKMVSLANQADISIVGITV
jgi:hypothetical protein